MNIEHFPKLHFSVLTAAGIRNWTLMGRVQTVSESLPTRSDERVGYGYQGRIFVILSEGVEPSPRGVPRRGG